MSLMTLKIQGQTARNVGDIITFSAEVPHLKTAIYDSLNSKNEDTRYAILHNAVYIEPNIKFRLIEKLENGNLKVAALPFSKKSESAKHYNYEIFEVEKDEVNLRVRSVEEIDRLSIGILTLPFKFSPQGSGSFETKLNFNPTLSIKLPNWTVLKPFYLQLSAGIRDVGLNQSNAARITAGEEIKAEALSFFGGLMVEYNRA